MNKIWIQNVCILSVFLCASWLLLNSSEDQNKLINAAHAETATTVPAGESEPPSVFPSDLQEHTPVPEQHSVQAILTPAKSAVISGTMDGVLIKMPYENGDTFKKGAVLAQYDCRLEYARIEEIKARIELSDRQLKAYKRLKALGAVAEIEHLSILVNNKQEKALLKQSRVRANLCKITAPFNGRVVDKTASNHEAVRSGRVLMEISELAPLKAELLVPSKWLRWLNIGAALDIYINESERAYLSRIIRVHGQVDPVTRTAHVVAEIEGYKEELLPGMSGKATFRKPLKGTVGFLGLNVWRDW